MGTCLDLGQYNNLAELLIQKSEQNKDLLAFIEVNRETESVRYTYGDVLKQVARLQALLFESHCVPGMPVAVIMQNQAKFPMSAISVFACGAILVPMDYKLTSVEQCQLIEHSEAQIIITEYHFFLQLIKARPELPGQKQLIVSAAPEGAIIPEGVLLWEQVPETMLHQPRILPRSREDKASIVYSSGTGGNMKGCMMTQGNYLNQLQACLALFELNPEHRFFSFLPSNHAIDFYLGFLIPCITGMSVVYQRVLRPQFIMSTFQNYRVTHVAFVPLILSNLVQKIKAKLKELSGIKYVLIMGLITLNRLISCTRPHVSLSRKLLKPVHAIFGGALEVVITGSAYVNPEDVRFFYQLGLPVLIGYGMTETGVALTLNRIKDLHFDTVGTALPNVTVKIENPDSKGVGEICVQTNSFMEGYLKNPELTQKTIQGDWLYTGDLGKMDDNGHLRIMGRLKNMIVTEGGKNIYPEDIEAQFNSLSEFAEFAVYAKNYLWPDSTQINENELILVYHLQEDRKMDLLPLIRKLNLQLTAYKRIHSVMEWKTAFPRTSSMKLKRESLAEALSKSMPEFRI